MADLNELQAAQTIKIVGSDESTAITSREDGAGKVGLSVELSSTNYVFSANNSTTVNLAANATFTGPVENAIYQQALSILCFSDQPGVLTINQYIDAAGLQNISQTVVNITAGVGFTDAPVMNGNYFNSTFKNTGLVATTNFAVNIHQGTIPRPINQINPVNDYFLNVQRGTINGHSHVTFAGYNPETGPDKNMVWSQSGIYVWKKVAAVCSLSSSSATDSAVGTGARSVLISGLDGNYNKISEIVVLKGLLSVNTVNSYLRVNSLQVATAGTTETNAGNITMLHTTTAIQYIKAGDGLSQSCFYTVPAGHKCFVLFGHVTCSRTKMSVDIYIRTGTVKRKIIKFDVENSEYSLPNKTPHEVPEGSDIWIEFVSPDGAISASSYLEIVQIKAGF